MFFHLKKEEKHKISRVLQKFDAFCDIFIGVFVSDLKMKLHGGLQENPMRSSGRH